MPLKADAIQETTTTTGTGSINLNGAEDAGAGDVTFRSIYPDGARVPYHIRLSGTEYEIGIGTLVDGTPDTISRADSDVLKSSNNDNRVDFTAGTKTVFSSFSAFVGADIVSRGGVLALSAARTLVYNSEGLIRCDGTSAAFTVTLPLLANVPNGWMRRFKRINTGELTNNITIDGNGSEQIGGDNTYVLIREDHWVDIRKVGSVWTIDSWNRQSIIEQLSVLGAGTWTRHEGIKSIRELYVTGPGGSGGRGNSTLSAAGGGAGGTRYSVNVDVSAVVSCAYFIGTGGAVVGTSANGNPGSAATTFTVGAVVYTGGVGGGGEGNSAGIQLGGGGGTSSGGTGLSLNGASGQSVQNSDTIAGNGGDSFWAGGGRGLVGSNGGAGENGSGGGGRKNTGGQSGAGGDGINSLTY